MAAGSDHTVLVVDDGGAIAFGDNRGGQTNVPALPAGLQYTAAAAGAAGAGAAGELGGETPARRALFGPECVAGPSPRWETG